LLFRIAAILTVRFVTPQIKTILSRARDSSQRGEYSRFPEFGMASDGGIAPVLLGDAPFRQPQPAYPYHGGKEAQVFCFSEIDAVCAAPVPAATQLHETNQTALGASPPIQKLQPCSQNLLNIATSLALRQISTLKSAR
jgi:hypothetical protein